MNPKMNSPISLVLLDRLNRPAFQFTRPYNECAELTVIHRDGKTYVYQHQTEFSDNKIFFKEAKQILDLNEVKGTVELKADFVRDPRALDYTLFLLQHNEISLGKAKEIVDYWCGGVDPLSSDLPVVTNDNPLVSDDDAPMDILRQVREDIIKRREQDVQDAALIAAFLAIHSGHLPFNWAHDLGEIVERLTADAHGKPVSENLKAKYTIKVKHPMRPGQISGLRLEEGQMIPEFIFKVHEDNILTEGQKAEGMTQDFIPGVGPVIRMPIKEMMTGSLVAEKITGIPTQILDDISEAAFSAMRQFADSVNEVINKFRNPG